MKGEKVINFDVLINKVKENPDAIKSDADYAKDANTKGKVTLN